MFTPGNVSSALAGLPTWLQPTADANTLDSHLLEWVRTSGWRAGGLIWPCTASPALAKTAQNGRVNATPAPPELADAVRRLLSGEATATATAVSGGLRVYAAINAPGRPMGVVWAERLPGMPFTEVDKQLVALTARLVEHSPAFAAATGPALDTERLLQRLQDAAVIAGRMAHDFDNILTGIMGFADLTLPLVPVGTTAARFVGEISKVGQRGIQFTQQLHQLSRSGQVKLNAGLLSTVVAQEEARLRPNLPAGLILEKHLPMGLPAVAMDAVPLQTVLGHLLDNAVEACPNDGTVSLTARPANLDDAQARAFLGKASAGAHLEVTVADSGPGLKPDVRRRLFAEPFFTTKIRHRGLGLAVVYRTLCSHRGGIRLESAPPPGCGTTARFVIPLAAARTPVAGPVGLGVIPVGG